MHTVASKLTRFWKALAKLSLIYRVFSKEMQGHTELCTPRAAAMNVWPLQWAPEPLTALCCTGVAGVALSTGWASSHTLWNSVPAHPLLSCCRPFTYQLMHFQLQSSQTHTGEMNGRSTETQKRIWIPIQREDHCLRLPNSETSLNVLHFHPFTATLNAQKVICSSPTMLLDHRDLLPRDLPSPVLPPH